MTYDCITTQTYFDKVGNSHLICQHVKDRLLKLEEIAEAGIKLRNYIEECYPGLHVTDTINEALAKLESIE